MINFHGEDVKIPVFINEKNIEAWLQQVAEKENQRIGELNFIFCSDNHLLQINQDFLNHDYFTDIITFDYSEENEISGDIFISLDRVEENAEQYQSTYEHELRRVMAHGCLHLLGYGDKSEDEQKLMTLKEEASLSLYRK